MMVAFLVTSLALSGPLSNLGIIVRQKSMVMYFLLFIILVFLDYKKAKKENKVQQLTKQTNAGNIYHLT
jgi:hypothetical protein